MDARIQKYEQGGSGFSFDSIMKTTKTFLDVLIWEHLVTALHIT